MSKKVPPTIPVIGQGTDSAREEQLRQWEEAERLRREQQAPASPVSSVPAVPVPVQAATTADEHPGAVAQSEVSAQVEAAGYLPMPEFTEPDSQDPAERLEFYSRGIFAVQYAARANHDRADQQRLIGLGLRLVALKNEELHKAAGYDTFGELTEDRFGIKKHQANNIIRVMPVARALEDITTQELRERPLRVLVPILETHGAEAIRKTWLEASRHGNVTDTTLKQAANFLGYGPPKELPAAQEEKPAPKTAVPVSQSLKAVERIRELAERDPARARREAEQLENAVRELLEELANNLE